MSNNRRARVSHQTGRLARGHHRSPESGVCVMELASMLAGERFSDRPASASLVIGAFLRTYNDGLDDVRRQDLYPLAALVVGTAGGRAVESERASRCLEFASGVGASVPTGRGAIAVTTPETSGTWAAVAAIRTGPSPGVHARAMVLVRELAALGACTRRSGWLDQLLGVDPDPLLEDARTAFEGDVSAT